MAPAMPGRMATTSIMPDGGAAAIGITERAATTRWTAAGASAAALAAGLLVFSAPAAAVVAGSGAVAPLAELHYRLDGRIVRVPVRLNGHALWFDVDSGARRTVVDAGSARALGLTIIGNAHASGAGHGAVRVRIAAPVTVAAGSARLRVSPWIIDLSHVGLSERVDGLIGADFFDAFVVRIDPVNRTLGLYDPASFAYAGSGAGIPLRETDDRLFVPMTLSLANGVSENASVRIDTGSGDAVSANLVRQSPVRAKSVQGVGLGRSYVDYSGVFSTVRIGPYEIHDVWGPSNDVPTVGMEILQRFVTTFDVPRGRLYLEPTAHLADPVPSPGA